MAVPLPARWASGTGGWVGGLIPQERWAGGEREATFLLSATRSPQDPALFGIRLLPDDSPAGPGEAGRLAPHSHHLPAEWYHGQPSQCHLPAIPGGGKVASQGGDPRCVPVAVVNPSMLR